MTSFENKAVGSPEKADIFGLKEASSRWISFLLLAIFIVYFSLIDLKGVWTDEMLRLGMMNGGRQFMPDGSGTSSDLAGVMLMVSHYAYQPLYYLLMNLVMRVTQSHDAVVIRGVNLIFLWAALMGVRALVCRWKLVPQLVALSVFSFNAYLIMHVMQIREYTLGITCMIWTTWFTLRLLRLDIRSVPAALPWFVGYGILLGFAFFNQVWIVVAAVAQGLVLLSRREQRLRFYALLAVPYALVIGVTLPYLLAHQNKVDVGKWDLDNTIARMWAGLLSGYHLVLGGTPTGGFHLVPGDVPTGAGIFDNTIAGFWLAVLAFGTILPAVRRFRPLIERGEPQTMVATALAWLTCLVMLVLRVVYFFTVDATSVSPHYFAVDYFFVILLIALAFNSLYTLAYDPSVTGPVKPLLRGGAALVMVMTVVSAIGQTATYYRDPYFDTYMSKTCNWSQLTNRISAVVANDDTILAYDFLFASTLTYVRPLPNQVISLIDLKEGMFGPGAQVAYLSMNLPPVMLETATADLGKLGLHPLRTVELSSPDWQGCTVMWQHVELRYFRKD